MYLGNFEGEELHCLVDNRTLNNIIVLTYTGKRYQKRFSEPSSLHVIPHNKRYASNPVSSIPIVDTISMVDTGRDHDVRYSQSFSIDDARLILIDL